MSVCDQLRRFRYNTAGEKDLEWRLVRSINVASAIDEEPDLRLMTHLLSHLSTCTLPMSTVQKATDVDLLQLLRVYQLSMQFALWSQALLKGQLVAAQQKATVSQVSSQYVDTLEKKQACLTHDLAQVRQERDTLHLTSANLNQALGKYETRCRMLERQLAVERERGDGLQHGLQRQAETFHAQALASSMANKDHRGPLSAAALPPVYIDAATGRIAWQHDRHGRARCPLCHQHARAKRSGQGCDEAENTTATSTTSTLCEDVDSPAQRASCTFMSRPGSRGSSTSTCSCRHHRTHRNRVTSGSRRRRQHSCQGHRRTPGAVQASPPPAEGEYVDWASFGRHLLQMQQQQQSYLTGPPQELLHSTPSPALAPRTSAVPRPATPRQNDGTPLPGAHELSASASAGEPKLSIAQSTVVPASHESPDEEGTLSLRSPSFAVGQRSLGVGGAPVSPAAHQRFPTAGSLNTDAKSVVENFLQAASRHAEGRGAGNRTSALAEPGSVENRLQAISLAVDALTDDLQEQVADVMRHTEAAVKGLTNELASMNDSLRHEQAEQRNMLQSAINCLHETAAKTLEQVERVGDVTGPHHVPNGTFAGRGIAPSLARQDTNPSLSTASGTTGPSGTNAVARSSGSVSDAATATRHSSSGAASAPMAAASMETSLKSVLQKPPTARRGTAVPSSPPPAHRTSAVLTQSHAHAQSQVVSHSSSSPTYGESLATDDGVGAEPMLTASPIGLRRAATAPIASLPSSPLDHSLVRQGAPASASFGSGQPRRLDSGASSYISLAEIRRTHGDEDHYNLMSQANSPGGRAASADHGSNNVRGVRGSHGTGEGLVESEVASPMPLSKRAVKAGSDSIEDSKLERRATQSFDSFDVGILRTPKKADGPLTLRDGQLATTITSVRDASHAGSTATDHRVPDSQPTVTGDRSKSTSGERAAKGPEDTSARLSSSQASVDRDAEASDVPPAKSKKKVIGSISSTFSNLSESDRRYSTNAKDDAGGGDDASTLSKVLQFGASTVSSTHSRLEKSRGGSGADPRVTSASTRTQKVRSLTSKMSVPKVARTTTATSARCSGVAPTADAGAAEEEVDLRHLTPKPSATSQFSEDMPAGAAARSAVLLSGSLNSTSYADNREDMPASASARAAVIGTDAPRDVPLGRTASAPTLTNGPRELPCLYCRKVFPATSLRQHEAHCAARGHDLDASTVLSRADSLNSSHRPASIMLQETQKELEALMKEEAEASMHRRQLSK